MPHGATSLDHVSKALVSGMLKSFQGFGFQVHLLMLMFRFENNNPTVAVVLVSEPHGLCQSVVSHH